ncbi:hypothetical protein H7849_11780 [Alloacidobacterium dinghuense]|uniref:Uncharacterized protein n=1 Tax=Alloacidobacterium dinghuense TaxID=2763107 RepID=A0A7G8BPN5_9BACT|nr:hypothetical protein [Alloacidobacterium dinghuense]QNI34505.1 hypothetical protein H7849_11780 [Alloacidobacterium dinghuense]
MANDDGKMSRVQPDQITALDRAAQLLGIEYRANLVVVITPTQGVCVPGGDVSFGELAKKLRSIADGLDQAHARYQGKTFQQVHTLEGMN